MKRWGLAASALCGAAAIAFLGTSHAASPLDVAQVPSLLPRLQVNASDSSGRLPPERWLAASNLSVQKLEQQPQQHAGSAAPAALERTTARLQQFREEDDWKNDLALFWMPDAVRDVLPRVVQSWARNYIFCVALYCIAGSLWAYYIYACYGATLFGAGNMPAWPNMLEQIKVSMWAMPMYSILPAVTEWVVEQGWTRSYTRIGEVGTLKYLTLFAVYMCCVEYFVYWSHRSLHDIRLGYRLLHNIHHKYNKEHTLSPFAGLAFHPLDGIIQALPYCWMLFVVPMHFLTFELLLFATGIWTTNIHDCLDGKLEPIMGAGYHTIHHTTYRHNYGHYFIYADWLHGTLVSPDQYEQEQKQK